MKKILFALSALVIFAVGCSKSDIDTTVIKYDLVVNIEKPSFGDSTRAARTSWEDGDVVYIVFNGDAYESKYLTLTYNDGSWTPNWVRTTAEAVASKETKTLQAGYMNTPVYDDPVFNIYASAFMTYPNIDDNGICVMTCSDGSYTVDGNTITLDITMKLECAQVTIRDIEVGGNWILKCDNLQSARGFFIPESGFAGINGGAQEGPLHGFANEDGVSFFGKSCTSVETTWTFTLSNGEKTYTRSFGNKQLLDGDAIIMDGPSSGKWEEVNAD